MILVWRITTRCNFACGFCAYDRRLGHASVAVDPVEVERFARLAADHAAERGERLLLSWLGGEPMLWPPLLELSERLAAHPAIEIAMTSNGTRLNNPAVQARILASFSELTVSLDGPPALHDRLRGAKGSYSRIEQAIAALVTGRRIAGAGPRLRVNVVLMHETLPHFAELCLTLAEWRIDEITFNQLGGRDRPDFYPDQRLQVEDIKMLSALLPTLKSDLAIRGVTLRSSDRYLDRIRASTFDQQLSVDDCKPGEHFLFIDENGLVAPCAFTGHHFGVRTSALRNGADIAALPSLFRVGLARTPASECTDCPSTQIFGKFAA